METTTTFSCFSFSERRVFRWDPLFDVVSCCSCSFLSRIFPVQCSVGKSVIREAPFEMCWFYMGIDQIAPPFQTGKCGKKCSKPSNVNMGKKCSKPSWQAFTTPPSFSGNAHMETTHLKKGLPLGNLSKTT